MASDWSSDWSSDFVLASVVPDPGPYVDMGWPIVNTLATPGTGIGGKGTGYRAGDWLADCDRCGFTFYASQIRLEWTGLRVCDKCYDYRHPQEFVRGVIDRQSVPWANPPSPYDYLTANEVSYHSDFSEDFLPDDFGPA